MHAIGVMTSGSIERSKQLVEVHVPGADIFDYSKGVPIATFRPKDSGAS